MSIVEKAADRLRESEQRESERKAQQRRRGSSHAPNSAQPDASPAPDEPIAPDDTTHPDDAVDRVVLDFKALRRAGLSPPEAMSTQIAREYQRIKRPILASLNGEHGPSQIANGNRLMVTSGSASEGKTFTAFNLSLSLARERDHRVLLVDGDVVKPGITRATGLRDKPGLLDLLADERMLPEDLILSTDVPGLSILPAGQQYPEMAELLSSRRMAWIARELSSDPTLITVFDSSPLLATAESQTLALNMGQILVVVKAGATERRALDAALSLISTPGRPISLILNQSRKGHGDTYAGYYGVYYGESDERNSTG